MGRPKGSKNKIKKPFPSSDPERFWRRVDIQDSASCWNWRGCQLKDGYGATRLNGSNMGAHRAAWILTYGDIPHSDEWHGTVVRHKCNNPLCCNPAHLLIGSITDNNHDTIRNKRHASMPDGPYGFDNRPMVKLTLNKVKDIRTFYGSGETSIEELSYAYGVSPQTVSAIINRKTWNYDCA